MVKKLIKDLIIYLPALLVPAIVAFFSIPIITRLFSTTDYGNYNLILAIIGPLYILIGWINMSVIRFYSVYEKKRQKKDFFNSVMTLSILIPLTIGLICFLILMSFKPRISIQIYNLVFIGIIIFIFTSIFEVLLDILRSKGQASWYSGFSIWRSISSITIGLILIICIKFGVSGLLFGTLISMILALPFLWKKAIGKFSFKLKFSTKLTKDFLKYGIPLAIANFGAWIIDLSDRYILKIFKGSSDVGIYSASYNIADKTIFFVSSLFLLASFPILVQMWEKQGEEQTRMFTEKITRYYLIVVLPLIVLVSVLAKPIMGIMAGPSYQPGYVIIPIIALGAFCLGLQQRFVFAFVYHKKTHFITYILVSAGLINIILNVIFIPIYGYMAAAFSTLISYLFLLILMIFISRKFFIWNFPFKSFFRILLASSISGIVIYFLINWIKLSNFFIVITGMVCGIIIYLIILLIFKEFFLEEIEAVKLYYKNIKTRLTKHLTG